MLRPLSKEWLKTLGRDFDFGELVWGKIDPHPWWPGQIYDEALATLSACLTKEKGRVLVAFFGDNTYGWLEPENVVPFEPHFDEKSKQSEDHLFLAAVEEALFEVKKKSALGLTCKCRNPTNFRPTEVKGFREVDVVGYGARSKFSIEQIKKARKEFKPREMFSCLQRLALNPTMDPQNNFTLTRNVARILAYRNSVFEEPDETYAQEFEAQAADSEHHADVSYAKKKPHQARLQLEALEGSPQYPRSSDPLKIDDGAKQAELKAPEVGTESNNLRKNVSQKRSLQGSSTPQLRIFDSDDLSRSNKKRSNPDAQEETITNKQKKGKTSDSTVARKEVVDNQYSDLQGDQISTTTAAVANHEERSTERIESLIQDAEQTVMIIKFFHLSRMPSVQHIKKEFANFGPFDESAVRTFSQSSTCQIAFSSKSKAQSAYHHALRKRNLFGLFQASYYIQPLEGSAAELAESSKPNMPLPQEDRHQVFAERVAAYPMGGRSWPYPPKPPGVYPPHYPAAAEEVGRLYPPSPARYTQVGGVYPPRQGYAYPPPPPPPPPGYGYPQQQQPPPQQQRGYGYPQLPPPPIYAYRPPALEEAPRKNIVPRWDQ